ncbi:MAG: GNAT family N-acetyltransferase [Nitrosopumilaceae archaeon]
MQLTIRHALPSDKKTILDFCKSTFSWGDYIHHVWDDWLDEGNFFVLCENKNPVAICHAFIVKNAKLVWIEGIRVDPNYRQKGYAKKLVTKAEAIAKKNYCTLSSMIIESKNFKSLKLAKKLHYTRNKKWNYYVLAPRKILSANIQQVKSAKEITSNLAYSEFYIRSWRWLPLDTKAISSLIKEKKIIMSKDQNCIDSLGIITESDHFAKTMVLTLIYTTKSGIRKILPYIQNLTYKKKFERIQILTKMRKLPAYSGLEKRLAFYHMTKNLD